jgi:hypothetical protein
MAFMPIRTGKTAYEIVMERTRPPRPDEPEDCLIYTGPTKNGGYGVLQFDKRKLRAHRVVMEHHHGPSDLDVLHSCDHKPCVNIAHLRYGDYSDNYEDRILNRQEFTRLCEVPLCTRKHAGRGMCQMHYSRWLRASK